MRQVKLSEVNKDIKVVDGKLFFGEKEVQGRRAEVDGDAIAGLYTIRVKPEDEDMFWTWRLATTLDVIGDKFWLAGGGINAWEDQKQKMLPSLYVDSWQKVEQILNTLFSDTAGKEWAVFEEEDFEASFAQDLQQDAEMEEHGFDEYREY